jgi:glycosyltransferase involved in cell wall biosynthesis
VTTATGAAHETPLVSVIVPARAGSPGLAETLASILGQTLVTLQVLVVTDVDDAAARARWGPEDGRLTMVDGPAAADVLAGIRGEYVAVVDADDVWHAEKLERQVAHLRERPAVDVSLAYAQLFWVDTLADGSAPPTPRPMGAPTVGRHLAAALVRARAFQRVGFFPAEPGRVGDAEWFVHARACELGVERLDELLLYRRLHRGNVARRLGEDLPAALPDVVKRLLGRRRGHPVLLPGAGRPP